MRHVNMHEIPEVTDWIDVLVWSCTTRKCLISNQF